MEKEKNKKTIYSVIAIVALLIFAIGGAYAYFVATGGSAGEQDVKVTINTVDNLTFSYTDSTKTTLSIAAGPDNFKEHGTNLTDNVEVKATLETSNAKNHTASYDYNLYLNIIANDFEYSLGDSKPELLLKVTGPDGEVKTNDKLNYKTVGEVSGFDITTAKGLIDIATPHTITETTDEKGTVKTKIDNWKIELILVNYEENQNKNTNKIFNSNVIMGKDEISVKSTPETIIVKAPTKLSNGSAITNYTYKIKSTGEYEIKENTTPSSREFIYTKLDEGTNYNILVEGTDKGSNTETVLNTNISTSYLPGNLVETIINKVPKVTSGSGLYHHTTDLPLGAEDGNYRYAGKGKLVNNWICLGSEKDCTGANKHQNMYRIMGAYKNTETNTYQTKVIKGDYITSKELGISAAQTAPLDQLVAMGGGEYVERYNNNYGKQANLEMFAWDTTGGEYGSNSWERQADLNNALNDTATGKYLANLESKIGTNKIASVTWQIGGKDNYIYTAKEFYNGEKSELTTNLSKIGLMSVSDYMYGADIKYWNLPGYDENGTLSEEQLHWYGNDYSKAVDDDWLMMLVDWTISRRSGDSRDVFSVFSDGNVNDDYAGYSRAVRPVFYLESDVTISGGDGTYNNPFILG